MYQIFLNDKVSVHIRIFYANKDQLHHHNLCRICDKHWEAISDVTYYHIWINTVIGLTSTQHFCEIIKRGLVGVLNSKQLLQK